jgi:hypothetical protein
LGTIAAQTRLGSGAAVARGTRLHRRTADKFAFLPKYPFGHVSVEEKEVMANWKLSGARTSACVCGSVEDVRSSPLSSYCFGGFLLLGCFCFAICRSSSAVSCLLARREAGCSSNRALPPLASSMKDYG